MIAVEKRFVFKGHTDCLYALEPGNEQDTFYSGGADGMVVAWQTNQPEHGKLLAKVPSSIYAMAYDLETNKLVIGQNFEGLHLLDLNQKQETASLKLDSGAIFDIKKSENHFLVAGGNGNCFAIDSLSFSPKKKIQHSDKSARKIAINPWDGSIAIGYSDMWIRIFEPKNFELIHAFPAHKNSVFCLTYTPDGTHLISGSRDAHLKVWDATRNYDLLHDIPAHLFAINDIIFHPFKPVFASCSMDKSIKIWDAKEYKLLKVIDKARHAGHGTSVNKLLWLGFEEVLISCSDDKTISSWSLSI